jgi:hypothetical protein
MVLDVKMTDALSARTSIKKRLQRRFFIGCPHLHALPQVANVHNTLTKRVEMQLSDHQPAKADALTRHVQQHLFTIWHHNKVAAGLLVIAARL